VQTVLPALVSRLGANNIAVGALAVILYVGVFLPQIFAARFVETLPWKKPWSVSFGLMQRLVVLVLAVVVWVFGGTRPDIALPLFLLFYTLNSVLAGIATPGWFDFYAKVTPLSKRGRLSGMRNSLGGAGGFLMGVVLTWLLATLSFPASYAIGLLLAFLLQMSSLVVQMKIVETTPSPIRQLRPMFSFLKEIPAVLRRNSDFRRFITANAVLIPAAIPVGFFTVYALGLPGSDESIVGKFTVAMVCIQVISALVTGLVADRYGNKVALVGASTAMLLASTTALLAPNADWFILVYMFVGIHVGSEIMIRYNLAIEFGPPEQRSMYVALTNTMLAPFYLSAIIAGAIIELFGFAALFGGALICSVVGIVMLIRFVRDPRFSATSVARSHSS
jgi:MFS family permease